ncbi:hypothetical protein FRB90_005599 [Tulasnella sp. 427]|nr:hypothetical protein FRB90_005599 [Tulasnella sp. 427]
MVAHLPWNSYRVYPPTSPMDKGRYYLKSDVERLDRHIKAQKSSKLETTGELRHELAVFQQERQAATKKIDQWYAGLKRRRQSKFNQRWATVSDVMHSRWGWKSVPYAELGPRMRKIVDWLLEVPVLSEAEWMYVQGDLKWAIRDEAKVRSITEAPREYTLRSTKSLS